MPEGWAWCRLGEIANLYTGNSINENEKTNKYSNLKEGLFYIATKDINFDGKIDYDNGIKIPSSEFKFKIAPAESTLLCIEGGSAGRKIGFINQNVCFVNKLCCFHSDYLKNLYLFYYLQSRTFKDLFNTNKNGLIGGVSLNLLKRIFFPLPPLAVQERIVSRIKNIFSQIGMLENNKFDLQTAIKQAKSKILDLAIHGKLVPQNPNDEPAEELLKRIATSDNRPYEKVDSSEIDWKLPKNWTLCHFGDIATIINGKNQSKVENPDGKYPIYGSGGIMGRADDYICPEKCTIIGRKGSINNPIFVEEKFWNVDTAFGLCPSEAVLPKFLFYFCEYFDFTTLDSSTTLPSLTKTNIQQIIFALPPIEEQERILDKTDELFDSLDEIALNLV